MKKKKSRNHNVVIWAAFIFVALLPSTARCAYWQPLYHSLVPTMITVGGGILTPGTTSTYNNAGVFRTSIKDVYAFGRADALWLEPDHWSDQSGGAVSWAFNTTLMLQGLGPREYAQVELQTSFKGGPAYIFAEGGLYPDYAYAGARVSGGVVAPHKTAQILHSHEIDSDLLGHDHVKYVNDPWTIYPPIDLGVMMEGDMLYIEGIYAAAVNADLFVDGQALAGLDNSEFTYNVMVSSVGQLPPVPIPPALILLGSGLFGIVAIKRKLKK